MSNISYDFKGKNIVVTGATSGIGNQIACSLAYAGAMVLAIGRRENELIKLYNQFPNNIVYSVLDITDYANVNSTIADFVKKYGKINGLVNCAGVSSLMSLRNLDIELAKEIMELNFFGALNIASAVLKKKNCENGTSVVLLASIAGHKGVKGKIAYGATKAAIIAAVKCIAKEIAIHGNRINTVSPGWIDNTEMTIKAKDGITDDAFENMKRLYPLGLGETSDIANMCMYLLSDEAKWVTGSDFIVDGGHLA